MGRHLTLAQKRKFFELILERDGGLHCLYCKKLQSQKTLVFEHLNGDNTDNRLDNLAFSCQSCNIKKSSGDERLIEMADAKLVANEQRLYVGEKFVKTLSNKMDIFTESSKEIEISVKNSSVVERYLRDGIDEFGSVLYKDALDSCVYLCKRNTGHGSQQSMRNYLAALTSSVAPYEVIRDKRNKKIIRKRL